jgi:hypothetical protein
VFEKEMDRKKLAVWNLAPIRGLGEQRCNLLARLLHPCEGLKLLPEQVELLWEVADLLVAIGSSEAASAIERLERKGVPQAERDVLSARLLVREQKWAEAVQLLVTAHA